uniref:Uncharacterized protein n=1 Tax=Arundo donax TaxID=35708 RepID=A0A0A9HGE4_ARUDO
MSTECTAIHCPSSYKILYLCYFIPKFGKYIKGKEYVK